MGTYSFDPDKCRNSLSKMVILYKYPLSMVDHIGCREFLHDLQPLFKVPSRNTLKSDILKIYECEKGKNMIALDKIESRISITTDMWTASNQKKGFMVITAHFIDDAWKLQSRILRFIYVPCPHTADVLSETLLCSLLDWNIDHICDIKLSLYKWLESPYMEVQMMAFSMMEKFNKYWSDIHGVLALAAVLHPRYKMMLVKYYYPLIFNDNAASEIEKVYQVCSKLVLDYQKKNDSSGSAAQSSTSSCQTETSSANNNSDRMAGFYRFVSNVGAPSNMKTELESFLDEPILPRLDDFDILTWWKVNAIKYPTLSRIAKDILAIPVSTVASESVFSTSGRFIIPHRNRLHPKTLEALMCTQDWLWADIHVNSTPSAYFGCCSKMNDEAIDEEVKAYTTRVGSGPFPTEILGKVGDLLRFAGQEFGTTTGRPRLCDWLDIVALKYCCQINGFSSLNLTKLDVLSELPEIQLGVSYKQIDGISIQSFPADLRALEQIKASFNFVISYFWPMIFSGLSSFLWFELQI